MKPVKAATSPFAIKAYISTFLFITASTTLLTVSTIAYLIFYNTFIPQIGLEGIIYLQYGDGPHPYAFTPVDSTALISQQPYDVSLQLHVPRTPTNLAAGNFMLDLSLITRPTTSSTASDSSTLISNTSTILFHSRRPAILPYQSPLLALSNTVISLPWHTVGLLDLDADSLSIPMFESLSFARGWKNIPNAAKIELQSDQTLQVYSARIVFQAQFQGLRYVIYNYRVLSFLVFTSCFYTVTLVSTALVWVVANRLLNSTIPDEGWRKIKQEPSTGAEEAPSSNGPVKKEPSDDTSDSALSVPNLSESATTSPTTSRQMPLRFPIARPGESSVGTGAASWSSAAGPSRPRGGVSDIKHEGEEAGGTLEATSIEPLNPDVADDEDEDEGRGRGRRDRDRGSGIGTSMESEGVTGLWRRRGSGRSRDGQATARDH